MEFIQLITSIPQQKQRCFLYRAERDKEFFMMTLMKLLWFSLKHNMTHFCVTRNICFAPSSSCSPICFPSTLTNLFFLFFFFFFGCTMGSSAHNQLNFDSRLDRVYVYFSYACTWLKSFCNKMKFLKILVHSDEMRETWEWCLLFCL